MKQPLRVLTFLLALAFGVGRADALSLALDSVAEWGRFPRFCVNTYRWGDRFFNSYDSVYVVGTGYKFNIKFKGESWTDLYNFNLPDRLDIMMTSDASTTVGVYLTYLAVSGGYDINVSKLLSGSRLTRSRFNFGFNCSLFAAEWNYVKNDVGTTIMRVGEKNKVDRTSVPFDGIDAAQWSLDTYYFFNHRRYSQAAAFNFSKVQTRSQGSMYAGLSFSNQKYRFDFSGMPISMQAHLPETWQGNQYRVSTTNYAIRIGYGYNWVFARHWLLGVTCSPVIGLRRGEINSAKDRNSFALANRFGLSVVWNNGRWFAGAVGKVDANLIYQSDHNFVAALITGEACIGYRFNIW